MTLVVCWVLFPIVLAALCAGCGGLLERVCGFRLPGALVLPAGLATLVVIATVFTAADFSAEFATPAVIVAAIAGLILGRPWRGRRIDRWALVVAVAVFAVFAAPVVLSGEPTFAGYIKLDDAATWFALTDRVMEHGPTTSGLPPSSYEATLHSYLVDSGYPVGAFLPMGVGRAIVREDLAWIFQPYLAFLASLLALGLYALVTKPIASPRLRALAAFVAAQPALLYGYGLWGGVKELAAVALMPLVAMLATRAASGEIKPRSLIALAVVCSAMLSIVSVGAAVWLAPVLAAALVLLAFKRRVGPIAKAVLALVVFTLVLSLPLILDGSLGVPTEVLTSQAELGNLAGPLDKLQVIGIWPAGDFRYKPADYDITKVLLMIAALAALGGFVWAVVRRFTAPLLYLFGAAVGCFAINVEGSPWADGKALATASPALLLFAMLGAAALFKRRPRAFGVLLAGVIAFGVLWSNVLAYHEVNLAPRDQLTELEQIGDDYEGQGPSLMTEYNAYGVRHFLRKLDPEGAPELRRRTVPLRVGGALAKGDNAEIDAFDTAGILTYRTLVLRNTPLASRPPLPYNRIRQGRYYDVWQRPVAGGPKVVDHLALGNDLDPYGIASCSEVTELATKVPPGGYLAAAAANPLVVLWVSRMVRPGSWTADPTHPGAVFPATSGKAAGTALIPREGLWRFWIGGGFRGELKVSTDGQQVASARNELNNPEIPLPLGSLFLPRGRRGVELDYRTGGARPGSGGGPFSFGPLVIAPAKRDQSVDFVPVAQARTLCGKRFDWIEAIAPSQ